MKKTLAIAGAMALATTAAAANTVDVTPGVVYGLDLLEGAATLAVTVVVGFIAAWARPFLGARVTDAIAEKVTAAARRRARARVAVLQGQRWTVEIENDLVADVAEYLGGQLPDALRHLGMTPVAVRRFAQTVLGEEIAALPAADRPEGYVGVKGLT